MQKPIGLHRYIKCPVTPTQFLNFYDGFYNKFGINFSLAKMLALRAYETQRLEIKVFHELNFREAIRRITKSYPLVNFELQGVSR